jgi:hypothetical protein
VNTSQSVLSTALFKKGSSFLIKTIQLQLFITLCSWPLLLWWGLPLSLLTVIGNILFIPFLTLFILISFFIFFGELVHIPNGFLIFCLEQLSSLWYIILGCATKTSLVSYRCPPRIFLITLPLLTCFIFALRRFHQQPDLRASLITRVSSHSLFPLIGMLVGTLCALHLYTQSIHGTYKIEDQQKNEPITLVKEEKTALILDPTLRVYPRSASSWVDYTLIPSLRTQAGIDSVDYLLVNKATVSSYHVVAHLGRKIRIKNLLLPTPKHNSRTGWAAYEEILRQAHTAHTNIILY